MSTPVVLKIAPEEMDKLLVQLGTSSRCSEETLNRAKDALLNASRFSVELKLAMDLREAERAYNLLRKLDEEQEPRCTQPKQYRSPGQTAPQKRGKR